MQAALRMTAWVQPGGKIEVIDSQLLPGRVDLIILFPPSAETKETVRRSVVDVLAEAPGHLAFQTAEEVDAYMNEERDAWER